MNSYEHEDIKVGTQVAVAKYRRGRFSDTFISIVFCTVSAKTVRQIKTDAGHTFRINDGCLWGVDKYTYGDDSTLYFADKGREVQKFHDNKKKTEKYDNDKRAILEKMVFNCGDDASLLQLAEDLRLLMEEYSNPAG